MTARFHLFLLFWLMILTSVSGSPRCPSVETFATLSWRATDYLAQEIKRGNL